MSSCPFCNFKNEDGALFCEQCKSDLSSADVALAIPMDEPMPMAEAVAEIPMAEAFEFPPMAEAVPVEQASPFEGFNVPPDLPGAAQVVEAVEEIVPIPVVAPVVPPPAAPVAVASDDPYVVPVNANPRLYIVRGQRPKAEYPIMEGLNFMGRADDKPVDIDLEEQENPEKVWCSRQHAVLEFDSQKITIEDLNSSNGTFLNRNKIYPGQKMPLKANDVIQIGSIQMKVLF